MPAVQRSCPSPLVHWAADIYPEFACCCTAASQVSVHSDEEVGDGRPGPPHTAASCVHLAIMHLLCVWSGHRRAGRLACPELRTARVYPHSMLRPRPSPALLSGFKPGRWTRGAEDTNASRCRPLSTPPEGEKGAEYAPGRQPSIVEDPSSTCRLLCRVASYPRVWAEASEVRPDIGAFGRW